MKIPSGNTSGARTNMISLLLMSIKRIIQNSAFVLLIFGVVSLIFSLSFQQPKFSPLETFMAKGKAAGLTCGAGKGAPIIDPRLNYAYAYCLSESDGSGIYFIESNSHGSYSSDEIGKMLRGIPGTTAQLKRGADYIQFIGPAINFSDVIARQVLTKSTDKISYDPFGYAQSALTLLNTSQLNDKAISWNVISNDDKCNPESKCINLEILSSSENGALNSCNAELSVNVAMLSRTNRIYRIQNLVVKKNASGNFSTNIYAAGVAERAVQVISYECIN